jgi:hypothetical protein
MRRILFLSLAFIVKNMEYRGKPICRARYPSFTLVVRKHWLKSSFSCVYRPKGLLSWHSEPMGRVQPCMHVVNLPEVEKDWAMVSTAY